MGAPMNIALAIKAASSSENMPHSDAMSRIAPLYIGGRALRANGQRPEIDMARAGVRGPTDQPKKCKLKGVKVLRLELVWLDRSQ